jgi:signal transduction histidine kinase
MNIGFEILDKLPLGALVIDQNYKIVHWNTILEKWSKFDREIMVGQDLKEKYPNVKNKRYSLRIDDVLNGGPPTIFSPQIHKYVIPIELLSGQLAIHSTTVSVFKSKAENFALISIQDVTDFTKRASEYRLMRDTALAEVKIRKEYELKLEEKNKEFEAFSYRVGHDLKSPLALIKSLTEMVMNEYDDRDLVQTCAEKIIKSSLRGMTIIEGLYKLSGLSNKKISYEVIDLDQLFKDLVVIFNKDIEEEKIKINWNCSHQVTGSAELIPQIFQNLISNAIKFSEQSVPEVFIYSKEKGDKIIINIEDNGPGIPEDKRKEIFQAFNRLHGNEVEGLGLGLNICKKILELHRGEIEVHAGEKLKGACFSVILNKELV